MPVLSNKNYLIIGAGAWGTAIATTLLGEVFICSRDKNVVAEINNTHTNHVYLPNIKLPNNIKAIDNIADCPNVDMTFFVLPAQALSEVLPTLPQPLCARFILASKGFDNKTHRLLSDVFWQYHPNSLFAVLSGPNFAHEVALGKPSTASIASYSSNFTEEISVVFNQVFQCNQSSDVLGVQLLGAFKNIFAIAAGILRGMGYSDNTNAWLITAAMTELRNILFVAGADSNTLMTPAGIGDLLLTCNSFASRNMSFGHKLGSGLGVIEALANNTVEGYHTLITAVKWLRQQQISAPIIEAVYHIVYHGIPTNFIIDAMKKYV